MTRPHRLRVLRTRNLRCIHGLDKNPRVTLAVRLLTFESTFGTEFLQMPECHVSPIRTLVEETGESPAVNQIEWIPFGHDQEMLAFCRRVRFAPWPTLAGAARDPTTRITSPPRGA